MDALIAVSVAPDEQSGKAKYCLECPHSRVIYINRGDPLQSDVTILHRLYLELMVESQCRCQLPPAVLAAIDAAVGLRVLSLA